MTTRKATFPRQGFAQTQRASENTARIAAARPACCRVGGTMAPRAAGADRTHKGLSETLTRAPARMRRPAAHSDGGRGIMAPGLAWDRLRLGASICKSFEGLCCRLAELGLAPSRSWILWLAKDDGENRERGRPAGVCLLRMSAGLCPADGTARGLPHAAHTRGAGARCARRRRGPVCRVAFPRACPPATGGRR